MDTLNKNHYHDSAFRLAWSMWKRRKWLAMLAFIAPFSAAISLVAGMPELYLAKTTILIQQDTLVDSMSDSPGGGLEARLQSINEEILSRSRLQELIVRFDLYSDLRQRASPEQVVERMRRDIRLQQKKIDANWGRSATVGFTLGYQSWDPQTAARIVNTLAALYVEENERRRPRQDGIAIAITSASAATATADKLGELRRELAELRANYSEHYPDISRVKAEITELERQQLARKEIGASAKSSNSRAIQEGQANATEGRNERQFLILDPAIPPEEPFAPNQIRLMFMALILAIGFAGVIMLLAEQFDTSFHQRGELWSYTNLPILASIPRIMTRGDIWRRRLRYTFIGILTASGVVLLVQASHLLGQNAQQLVWMLAQRGV